MHRGRGSLSLSVVLALALLCAVPSAMAGPDNPAPDYSNPSAWAAWPGRPSGADAVPPGLAPSDRSSEPKADVFFIHPTTFLTGGVGNAAYDAPGLPKRFVDETVLRFQAGAFNACCRVFVPRYRQAKLRTFFSYEADSVAALDLAYSDVRRAFEYYIAHENHGRPFILASHSQGSSHAMRLLQEVIAGRPLQARMVAAYVVGYSIPNEMERIGLPVCAAAQQTNCLIHWATVAQGHTGHPARAWIWWEGRYQAAGDRLLICVNPLSWERNGVAPAKSNIGALPHVRLGQPMPKPMPALTGATCDAGMLGVAVPFWARPQFSDVLTIFGSYHDFDYHLFYMNIRENANGRVAAFLGDRRAGLRP